MAQEPIIQQTKEFIADALEDAKARLEAPAAAARKQLGDLDLKATSRRVADSATSLWKKTRKQVQQNPEGALCVGAFVGLALGLLLRGRD